MKKQKWLKRMMALVLAFGMLLSASRVAYAASPNGGATVQVGSTSVTVSFGFNGNTAFAKVSANGNVDVTVYALLYNDSNEIISTLRGTSNERSYAEFWANYSEDIVSMSCKFTIISADGNTVVDFPREW